MAERITRATCKCGGGIETHFPPDFQMWMEHHRNCLPKDDGISLFSGSHPNSDFLFDDKALKDMGLLADADPGAPETIEIEMPDCQYHPKFDWEDLTPAELKDIWYKQETILGFYSFSEVAKAVEERIKAKNHVNPRTK